MAKKVDAKTPLLSVKDLRINFSTDHGYVQAVRGVSFDLYKGETLCIVGESGSGKSVTNKAIMGILSSNGRIVDGSIMYEGEDLTKVSEDEFHRIRGHKIGMIFQDPLSSLNPIMRIGKQITEAMLINGSHTKKMYDDLVSDELVAYKNAKTELRTGLAKYSDNIKFLKSEKKKQIAQAKNKVSNELEGKIYTLKREFGSTKFSIDDEYSTKKGEYKLAKKEKRAELRKEHKKARKVLFVSKKISEEKDLLKDRLSLLYFGCGAFSFLFSFAVVLVCLLLKRPILGLILPYLIIHLLLLVAVFIFQFRKNRSAKENATRIECKKYFDELKKADKAYYKEVKTLKETILYPAKEDRKQKLSDAKAELKVKIKEIKNTKSALVENSNLEIKELTEKYDKQIADLVKHAKKEKKALRSKYKPLIKENKEKFKVKSKEAKEKVKAFKAEKLSTYKAEKKAIYEKEFNKKKKEKKPLGERFQDIAFMFLSSMLIILISILLVIIALTNYNLILILCALFVVFVGLCFIFTIVFIKHKKFGKAKDRHRFSLRRLHRDLKAAKYRYVSSIKITKEEAKAKALKIMEEVGIKDAEKRFRQYPFEFSGGMRQRIVIAIALTADPDILICDEPTTALDVTIQAQILELINNLKKERELSCIFITHDLGVVANMADRVAVMYAGKIVEYGTEDEIFYDPRHPYTWALLSSIPDVDSNEKLEAIPGTPPNMIYPPKGDAFALRSKYAMEIDFKKEPPFFKVSDTHYAATWLLDPRAPKVEMPKIVKTRIANSLKQRKEAK